jgi:hypothetical protein
MKGHGCRSGAGHTLPNAADFPKVYQSGRFSSCTSGQSDKYDFGNAWFQPLWPTVAADRLGGE